MDALTLALAGKYRRGELPPQMAVQLEDPRRLLAYDIFDRTTTQAEGLGVSTSEHQWTTRIGIFFIQVNGLARSLASGDNVATIDVPGNPQHSLEIHALLRTTQWGSRRHGIVVSFKDVDNYVRVATYDTILRIEKVVDGQLTVLASGATNDVRGYNMLEWITVHMTPTDNRLYISASRGPWLVSYDLMSDPDWAIWEGNIQPGLFGGNYALRCSRFYVLDGGIEWAE